MAFDALSRTATMGSNIREKWMTRVMSTVVLATWVLASAIVTAEGPQTADEAAIREAVVSYVTAFNRGDAQALAAMWSPEAVYTNPLSGQQVVGREQIQEQFAGIFAAGTGVKLEAETRDVQFVSPNVAIEQGNAKIIRPDGAPEESEYTAVYVKRDGQWLLDRVTEEGVPVVQSNYEHLKELEWMIGSWVDRGEQSSIETTCGWTKNRNFMTRMFAVTVRDRVDMAGMQVVGWDPAAEQIRSWVFDSDGGFGQGLWTRKGKAWHIQLTGMLPDGSKSSSVSIITPVDEITFTWQSVNRVAGGELLPNIDEVVVTRQTTGE
jgi:uncharacterized protein (TIGR02246 family)